MSESPKTAESSPRTTGSSTPDRTLSDAVLITGSAGGIGTALCHTFSATGATVIGVDRVTSEAADISFRFDVADESAWDEVTEFLSGDTSPRLATLVTAAGSGTRTDMLSTSLADWTTVIAACLTGTWLAMKACHPFLASTPGSSIVTVGSMYGKIPPPGPPNLPSSPAYQSAKAGVHALTRTAASEFAGDGIRVNGVVPGLFRTGLTDTLTSAQYASRLGPVALQRDGDTRELAEVVEFLASPKATYMTGSLVDVDGGHPLCL